MKYITKKEEKTEKNQKKEGKTKTLTSEQKDEIELYVKRVLSPKIRLLIGLVNKELAPSGVKIVIAGGAAFEFYFQNHPSIQTHDYDLRIYFAPDPLSKNVTNFLSKTREYIVDEFFFALEEDFRDLNIMLPKKFEFLKDHKGLPITNLFTSYSRSRYRLKQRKSINYELFDDHVASLIDFVIEDTLFTSWLGEESICGELIEEGETSEGKNDDYKNGKEDLEDDFEDDIEDDTSKTPLSCSKQDIKTLHRTRSGYFKKLLDFTCDDSGLCYVSLGHLFWDTVRMLNWSIDEMYFREILGAFGKGQVKLKRYVNKYLYILKALNEPEEYLTCTNKNFRKYCLSCLLGRRSFGEGKDQEKDQGKDQERSVCTTKMSSQEVIQLGIEKGYFPPSFRGWKDLGTVLKRDYLCQILDEIENSGK